VSVEKKHVEVAIALVWNEGRLLVSRRRADAHLGGYWEFPGGKLKTGESAEACAEREVLEEVGVTVRARARRKPIVYEYPDRVVTLTPVDCDWVSGVIALLEVAEARWVERSSLDELEFPPANAPLLRELGAGAG
jgi:mutator protein MutT